MADPNHVDNDPAYKLFIRDLINLFKQNNVWHINFGNKTEPRPVLRFLFQATVVKLMGFENEIMIVDDKTGKSKVTRGKKVPGDFSWLRVGSVCSIVGVLLEGGKLPHIDIVKMAEVDNSIQERMWPLEVEELHNFFANRIAPDINQRASS